PCNNTNIPATKVNACIILNVTTSCPPLISITASLPATKPVTIYTITITILISTDISFKKSKLLETFISSVDLDLSPNSPPTYPDNIIQELPQKPKATLSLFVTFFTKG